MSTQQLIVDLLLLTAILVVGFILSKQIKTQAQIIQSFKSYFEIFDIEKLKALDKFRHETSMMRVKAYLQTELKKEIKPALETAADALRKDVEARFDEVCNVMFDVILTLEPEERKQFVRDNLPHNQQAFLDALEEVENDSTASSADTAP